MLDFKITRFRRTIRQDGAVEHKLAAIGMVVEIAAVAEHLFSIRQGLVQALVHPVPDGAAHNAVGRLDGLPVIRQVAHGVHHVVCVLGNIVGLGEILVARHGTRPVHGRILVGPQVHNVIIAFVVGGAGHIPGLHHLFRTAEILAGAGFIPQGPHNHAGMVLVALHHRHDAVHVGRHPLNGMGKGLLAIVIAVGLDVGLILHVNAVLVTEVIKIRIRGIMGTAHVVDIGAFHHPHFFLHLLRSHVMPCFRMAFMAVHALYLHRLAVYQEHAVLNHHIAETHAGGNHFFRLPVTLQRQYQGVQVGILRRP